jgi:L-arabinose isomerase
MIDLKQYEVWFVTGSQHLYGPETLKQVDEDSKTIVASFEASKKLPVRVVFKPVLTTPDSITQICREANNTPNCIGLVAWMHTFSPAKMWIAGLTLLSKPLLHLDTQFNRDIPWATIDMDFMNLNQSAHGDREFGFICARLRKSRKIVVGHWQEQDVLDRIGAWMRAAAAWQDSQGARFVRFGDNMRQVAVTEGDKVEAQIRFGWSVNTHGVGDLLKVVNEVTDAEIEKLCSEYDATYVMQKDLKKGGARRSLLREAARIEVGLRGFLEAGGYKGYTDTFEDLHGLKQLPGIASQRLMADGYGFGAEGDWKLAALVRTMKVMSAGLKGGTSFMEDYTYHFNPKGMRVLGAHMLEICPSIAAGKSKCEAYPLGIGGKDDPVRLTFDCATGPALNATLVDMGNRFRMIVNTLDVVKPEKPMPNLPVAQVVWDAKPNLKVAAAAWIEAGGAHHSGFTMALTKEHMEDFANIAGVEQLVIDEDTCLSCFKKEIRSNEVYYHIFRS